MTIDTYIGIAGMVLGMVGIARVGWVERSDTHNSTRRIYFFPN
jgi:hypothetical protein